MLKELLKKENMSVYKCSKLSHIPYTTLLELVNNKTSIENCSLKTIYMLANILNISIDSLVEEIFVYRMPFEEFRSELCHELKRKGDIDFLKENLINNNVKKYFEKNWIEEALYLLAMIDCVSRENNIPLATDYNKYRHLKLKNIIYPRDVELLSKIKKTNKIKKEVLNKSIKEFKDHNIAEVDIRNVR